MHPAPTSWPSHLSLKPKPWVSITHCSVSMLSDSIGGPDRGLHHHNSRQKMVQLCVEGGADSCMVKDGSPLEGAHENAHIQAPEVLRQRDHAEGVQAQPQRVALHALVVLGEVAQVGHVGLQHPATTSQGLPQHRSSITEADQSGKTQMQAYTGRPLERLSHRRQSWLQAH